MRSVLLALALCAAPSTVAVDVVAAPKVVRRASDESGAQAPAAATVRASALLQEAEHGVDAGRRAALVRRLAGRRGAARKLKALAYNRAVDGLLWSGTARSPAFVFTHGFQKPYEGTDADAGEDVEAWAQKITESIVGNERAWGFHFTTNPKVAAQFGVYHVANSDKPYVDVEHECRDAYDNDCVRQVLERHAALYGCPAPSSPVWTPEPCWSPRGTRPCHRADKLSDPDFGLEGLCPNWGYAYVVKADGLHVRVNASNALGKDYEAEEEVFVPYGVQSEEILGAIPVYARKAYDQYNLKNPGLINFESNWDGEYGWKSKNMRAPAAHTKAGRSAESGLGAFIFNPGYKGNAAADLAAELRKKGIAGDLGTAVPKEAP